MQSKKKDQEKNQVEEGAIEKALDMLKSRYYANNFGMQTNSPLWMLNSRFKLTDLLHDLKSTAIENEIQEIAFEKMYKNKVTA